MIVEGVKIWLKIIAQKQLCKAVDSLHSKAADLADLDNSLLGIIWNHFDNYHLYVDVYGKVNVQNIEKKLSLSKKDSYSSAYLTFSIFLALRMPCWQVDLKIRLFTCIATWMANIKDVKLCIISSSKKWLFTWWVRYTTWLNKPWNL